MTQTPSPTTPDFPWAITLTLGLATMLMVAAEMLPTAVLGPMSTGLGVGEAQIATLVSVWAGVVVLASFPLSRLARRWPARTVIIVGLIAVAISSALTAVAPNFGFAVAARVLGAAAVGLLWATVNAFVADIVDDRLLGRAVGIVLGGATFGVVIGTPLARLVADATDWRIAFAVLAGLLTAAAVAVGIVVPSIPRDARVAQTTHARSAGRGIVLLAAVASLVAIALIGHYGAYTFITRLAEPAASILPGGIGAILFLFGIASAAGVALAARVGRGATRALAIAIALTGIAVAATLIASPVVSLAAVALWGVASGAFPPLAQTLILRIAGQAHRDFAGALMPVLFNGGIAVGAAAAAGVVGYSGSTALPIPAAAVIIIVAGVFAVLSGRGRRDSRTEHEETVVPAAS
ncbi:MAG TPA: MFS transporter [Microbacterium sp.]|nr:MFS transporter [Microbacterium sp.]